MKISKNKKVPYVEQMQQTECGLCCIAMLLRYYNSYQTLSELREYIEAGRDGIKISDLKKGLIKLGFETHIYKADFDDLYTITLPAVIYINNDHFVVLEKLNKSKAVIVDPSFGRKTLTIDECKADFTDFVLTAEPNENFSPVKKGKNIWFELIFSLQNLKKNFVSLFSVSILTYFIILSIPIFVQQLIDMLNNGKSFSDLKYLIVTISVALLTYLGLLFIKGTNILNITILLDKSLIRKTFRHLLDVPYKFFEVRPYGDILFRLSSLNTIRDLLSQHLINGLIDLGALIFIIVYMLNKSIILSMIAIILFTLNGIFIICSRKYLKESNQKEITSKAKLNSIQSESIYAIFGIKVAGIENEIYKNWNKYFKDVIEKFKNREKLMVLYNAVTGFFQTAAPFFILLIGLYLLSKKELTIGEIIAFYSLSNTFFSLTNSIFRTWNNFILASSYLERVKDITDTKVEINDSLKVKQKLQGNICLKNVSFAYTKNSDDVLKNINIDIKKGQKIAFVGASGSGKSTLTKILLGLYTPTKGKIYYDGIDLNDYNKNSLRKQMGVVPQDIALFNKSILENIRLNNKNISLEEVMEAAKISQIADEIESMPMGYYTILSDMGMNLSGGQRQRIALARAILANPKIIVLDEATSSLDSINEANVSNYFKHIGCTRIVIAHRLSTVIDSDIIYVMKNGEIVESGTHDELIEKKGAYCDLYYINKKHTNLVSVKV